jgi:D-glycero-D-manno-heptose 1,7-bisphosphate phosphatase
MPSPTAHPAAFLDRDGTMIVEHGFLSDPEGVEPLPGAIDAIRQLNEWGYLVFGVTNQSGVARGYFGEDAVRAVNRRVIEVFAASGARIDAIYYCPHYPMPGNVECDCRKPKRGMIDQAMRDFAIDLSRSFTVGDRLCDVKLGETIGRPGLLVLTGFGHQELADWSDPSRPDHVAASLRDAVRWWGQAHHGPSVG